MLKGDGKIISTEEAARLLGVSQQSVRKWCQSGKIRAKTTPGGFYKIERSELERFRQEFNMPNLDSNEYVLIIEENQERVKFISGLLEMLDFEVVTADNLIGIGIAIGQTRPSFIISGTSLSKLDLEKVLVSFMESVETKNIPILIISEEGQKLDGIIDQYKSDRKLAVLSEPLDIHQFKRKVEELS
ncbi:MAG: helix-turn-helix domain-containing protein [Spirochaetes bacterium]|nr:helix-turn-helix domain-containing protein [Spirochaetota bacterium]